MEKPQFGEAETGCGWCYHWFEADAPEGLGTCELDGKYTKPGFLCVAWTPGKAGETTP